jgi:hypothetical protein
MAEEAVPIRSGSTSWACERSQDLSTDARTGAPAETRNVRRVDSISAARDAMVKE